MNALSLARRLTGLPISDEADAENARLLRESFERSRAAKAAARYERPPEIVKTAAHINGTAYRALNILQREIVETAVRYRNLRASLGKEAASGHKIALFALLRVRRELRDAYPSAKPFWELGL